MRKHAETFHANKGSKMAIACFIPVLPFSKRKFRVQFSFFPLINKCVSLHRRI